jgi:hypothetical protein
MPKETTLYNQTKLSRRHFLQATFVMLGGCAAPTIPLDQVITPTQAAPVAPQQAASFSGDNAYQHVVEQMHYIPRHPGTEGWRKCGDYILEQYAAAGWTAEEQPFTYRETDCRNLIAKRGEGPLIIMGAHYDSRKWADEDPDPNKRKQPVPAANDGASGVAILLELARVLQPETLNRTIWLVAFDAEDNGGIEGWDWIVGSSHFVEVLTETVQGMVLFDMIGDADQQIYYERNSYAPMNEGIWNVAKSLNYTTFIPEPRYSMLDDHTPFIRAGIPAVDLIDFDYPYWHTTADTLDKVSAGSLEAVGRTAETWLLQGAPGMPSTNATFLPIVCKQAAVHTDQRVLASARYVKNSP